MGGPNTPAQTGRVEVIPVNTSLAGKELLRYESQNEWGELVSIQVGKVAQKAAGVTPFTSLWVATSGIAEIDVVEVEWGLGAMRASAFVDVKGSTPIRVFGSYVRVMLWSQANAFRERTVFANIGPAVGNMSPVPPTFTARGDSAAVIVPTGSKQYEVPPFANAFLVSFDGGAAGANSIAVHGLNFPAAGETFRFIQTGTVVPPLYTLPEGVGRIKVDNLSAGDIPEPSVTFVLAL